VGHSLRECTSDSRSESSTLAVRQLSPQLAEMFSRAV
jgi:hypothetical protein